MCSLCWVLWGFHAAQTLRTVTAELIIDRIPFLLTNYQHQFNAVTGQTKDTEQITNYHEMLFPKDTNILLFLSILTAIFPGGPGLASTRMSPFWIVLVQRMMYVVVTTGAMMYKAPVKSSPSTNQHSVFTGQMPILSPNRQCQNTYITILHNYATENNRSQLVRSVCRVNDYNVKRSDNRPGTAAGGPSEVMPGSAWYSRGRRSFSSWPWKLMPSNASACVHSSTDLNC